MENEVTIVVQLATTNDTNGNPRRVFVGYNDAGTIVATRDEGYSGRPDWAKNARTDLGRINVTPGEYREFKRAQS